MFASLALALVSMANVSMGETLLIFNDTAHRGGWDRSDLTQNVVDLPAADRLGAYNTMAVEMTLACPAGGSCGPWDFFAYLTACPVDDDAGAPTAGACDVPIAFWVTPYGKPGTWRTDISGLLARMREGGRWAFAFWTPQAAQITLQLHLSNQVGAPYPVRAVPLFFGASVPINLAYNDQFLPQQVTLEALPTRADLYVLMLSQGQGGFQQPDCAEFCNLTHIFNVNDGRIERDFSSDLTPNGCRDKVSQGVIADQKGTWPVGRAGWCPGWHVLPWVRDVTSLLTTGTNTVRYQALYQGKPYDPTPVANPPPNSFAAQIQLASWLILWADKPGAQAPVPAEAAMSTPGPDVVTTTATGARAEPALQSSAQAQGFGCQTARAGAPQLGLVVLGAIVRRARQRVRRRARQSMKHL